MEDIFGFDGGVGGMLTRTAGGSGNAVSFILTITLSTLPSLFERVSLLNKLLNCDTDNEFVIVLEETDETSEDAEEVMDDEIVPRGDSNGVFEVCFNIFLSKFLEANSFFSNHMLFVRSAIDGRSTGSPSPLQLLGLK